jgi:hypothetical protein
VSNVPTTIGITTWALTTDKDNFFNGLENQTLKINDVKIKLEIILK